MQPKINWQSVLIKLGIVVVATLVVWYFTNGSPINLIATAAAAGVAAYFLFIKQKGPLKMGSGSNGNGTPMMRKAGSGANAPSLA